LDRRRHGRGPGRRRPGGGGRQADRGGAACDTGREGAGAGLRPRPRARSLRSTSDRRGGRVMAGAIEMYRRSVEGFGQRAMAIGDGDWDRPTPCADWTVRDLVRHLVYEELWTPPLLEG